jgi:hypothetical protein
MTAVSSAEINPGSSEGEDLKKYLEKVWRFYFTDCSRPFIIAKSFDNFNSELIRPKQTYVGQLDFALSIFFPGI